MILDISDVGRTGATWALIVADDSDPEAVAEAVYRSVKLRGVLMSSSVEVTYDAETGKGNIWVGGVRCVGRVSRRAPEATT